MKRVIVMGAGGRDFHDFNVVLRDDPDVTVVAFTAAQIPGIDDRTYPATYAGPRYPDGIPIVPEEQLAELIARERVDEVVFAYSDVSYDYVMGRAQIALAAGADFRLIGPRASEIPARVPVVGVCAVRTGAGKSQTSRAVGRILIERGLRVGLIRHPMPYHDLEDIGVQRFRTLADIDASNPTVEEREEYERPLDDGIVVYAGVDYEAIAELAATDGDVIIWDGGNNDLPFLRCDLLLVVVDPLRAGDELAYHPGEANLRKADVVVINKLDSADPEQIERVRRDVELLNPDAPVIEAESPVVLADGLPLEGRPVLVVEDGPSVTHGGMAYGAGTVAARQAGAVPVDPRPFAVGSIAETFARFPHLTEVLPAMGYSAEQLRDLERTIAAVDCEAVIAGTPIDLGRLIESERPIRTTTYEFRQVGGPSLEELLEPVVAAASGPAG